MAERYIAMKPTMGRRADEYRLLLNVVPRGGKLERRPALRCVDIGFSAATHGAPSGTAAWDYGAVDLTAQNRIAEGIDVAVVHGKLLLLYVWKTAGQTPLRLYMTAHWPTDPRMGPVAVVGQDVADSQMGDPDLAYYRVAQFWKRRIFKVLGNFMLTGKSVGAAHTGTPTGGGAGDDLNLFNGYPLIMLGTPTAIALNDNSRTDPFNTIYVSHRPRNAFAHLDRLGQVIYYGFTPGELYSLNAQVPANQILTDAVRTDFKVDATTGADELGNSVGVYEYDVWYSEPWSPLSLSVVGLVPVLTGSRSAEVVGMAEWNAGTVVFTRDTIQYLQGVGADPEGLARRVIHAGIGADSQHSIKMVSDGVAFLNKRGLWHLSTDNAVRRVDAFDELFAEGVENQGEKGPYGRFWSQSETPAGNLESPIEASTITGEMGICQTADVLPWQHYKVDKTRLDRAVAGIWDDLYICACSMVGHTHGDDNRLVLVWNYIENTCAVWLLPVGMGIRGFAYDEELSVPYVMTRYGLARFDGVRAKDTRWVYNDTNGSTQHADAIWPPVHGMTREVPETGDVFVPVRVLVNHSTGMLDTVDADYAMRIQVAGEAGSVAWSQHALVAANVAQVSNADNGPLEGIFGGVSTIWRRDTGLLVPAANRHNREAGNTITRRLDGQIRRTSIGRSTAHVARAVVMFHMLGPTTIQNVQLGFSPVAPKGNQA